MSSATIQITFELSRLLEGVDYIRHKFNNETISADQINNYLLEISQQIQAISPQHIKHDLFIMHPPPKRVLKLNKRRISILSPRKSGGHSLLMSPSKSARLSLKEESKSPDFIPSSDIEDGGGSRSNSEDEAVQNEVVQNIMNQPRFRVKTLREVQFEDLSLKKQCKLQFYSFSEPQTKYVPIPLDDQYPEELYVDTVRPEQQSQNMYSFPFSNSDALQCRYPDDEGANLQDFIKRKFHLNANVVKQWVNDRAALMDQMGSNGNGVADGKYRKFAVIDVRCHDFVGGNIPFCFNVDFEVFESMLNDLLIHFQYESDMVFHCMYSQHRGPRAAFWYWQKRRNWERRYPQKLRRQRVWVLDGGFKQWISDHILDGDLVANVQSKCWDEEYFPLTGREFFYRNDWRVPDSDHE